MSNKSILASSSIFVIVALFMGLNAISDRVFSRFSLDLTDEGLYSLSDGTKKIINELQEPLVLRLYLSKSEGAKYPLIKIYGQRVKDLLNEYQTFSKEKIKVEFYDPKQDTEDQEWAQKYGLTPIPLPTGGELYFGLAAVNSLGKEEALPIFDIQRQEFLEYDITKLIYSLGRTSKPLIGIISALNILPKEDFSDPQMMQQQAPQKWVLASQLEKFARLVTVGEDIVTLPDDMEELMIIHPKNLSDKQLYAIDQFLMKGGRIFVAVDSYAAIDAPPQDPQNPMATFGYARSSNLEKLFSKWGLDFNSKSVVGDMNIAANVSAGNMSQPIQFPAWLMLNGSSKEKLINRDSIVTSQLDNVVLPWAGSFELKKMDGITSEVLMKTTAQAGEYDENVIRFSAQNPEELSKKFLPGNTEKILALSLSGKFQSAFDAAPEGAAEHIKSSTTDGVVIAISDVDFLTDQYSSATQNIFGTKLVSLINDNLIFLANVAENLSGSNSLISLRSRGKFARPFEKVQEIELAAQDRWKAQEESIQAKLNQANQRLAQLESGSDKTQAVFSNAMVEEIRKFREERSEAQKKLREVRRKLREDKEGLGNLLFALNTFFIPSLILLISFYFYGLRGNR